MSLTSRSILSYISGRWTFTATCVPSSSIASCTCAMDAAPKGMGRMRSNTAFHGLPYSSLIISLIWAVTSVEASVLRLSSFLQYSMGMISGCIDRSCPNLTKVGPSSLSISQSLSGSKPCITLYLLITLTISSRRLVSPVSPCAAFAISYSFNLF